MNYTDMNECTLPPAKTTVSLNNTNNDNIESHVHASFPLCTSTSLSLSQTVAPWQIWIQECVVQHNVQLSPPSPQLCSRYYGSGDIRTAILQRRRFTLSPSFIYNHLYYHIQQHQQPSSSTTLVWIPLQSQQYVSAIEWTYFDSETNQHLPMPFSWTYWPYSPEHYKNNHQHFSNTNTTPDPTSACCSDDCNITNSTDTDNLKWSRARYDIHQYPDWSGLEEKTHANTSGFVVQSTLDKTPMIKRHTSISPYYTLPPCFQYHHHHHFPHYGRSTTQMLPQKCYGILSSSLREGGCIYIDTTLPYSNWQALLTKGQSMITLFTIPLQT